ncbi:MAG: MarR family winged helix-turn-helix transcriptional regulator [Holosporales bacterium]|jgi:DNA-binding MarR family transcriptional regulator|nr:MarR family winged helix-turn-helix transcriptional regulator [Holosporales bacterium]
MKNTCIEVSIFAEKLYRLFLDIIKLELDALSVADINGVQALTLINIGNNTITVGELTTKCYYTGSNASYNIKKMITNGYIIQKPAEHDKRSCYIKLSAKGVSLLEKLTNNLEKYYTVFSKNGDSKDILEKCVVVIKKINATWKDFLVN